MTTTTSTSKLPYPVFGPLKSEEEAVDLIAEVTGKSQDVVLGRLKQEIESPGCTSIGI